MLSFDTSQRAYDLRARSLPIPCGLRWVHRLDDRRSPLLGSLTVAVAACLFAMLGVLSRFAFDLGLTPFAFVTWRAGVAALVMAAIIAVGLRRGRRLVSWRSLDGRARASLGVAALMGATLDITMFQAFARVPVAIVLLCFYTFPAIVAGASALLGWDRMDRPRAVALVIALGGMVAVVIGGATPGNPSGLGPPGGPPAPARGGAPGGFLL